jgi:hypothetical protein
LWWCAGVWVGSLHTPTASSCSLILRWRSFPFWFFYHPGSLLHFYHRVSIDTNMRIHNYVHWTVFHDTATLRDHYQTNTAYWTSLKSIKPRYLIFYFLKFWTSYNSDDGLDVKTKLDTWEKCDCVAQDFIGNIFTDWSTTVTQRWGFIILVSSEVNVLCVNKKLHTITMCSASFNVFYS